MYLVVLKCIQSLLGLTFNEVQSVRSRLDSDSTDIVRKRDTIALLSNTKHLWSEGSANELSTHGPLALRAIFIVVVVGKIVKMVSDSRTVLGVEVGIDLVEDVEWRGIGGLNGKDEGQTAQTCEHVSISSDSTRAVTYSSVLHSIAGCAADRHACC